jgi:hypothetical protein
VFSSKRAAFPKKFKFFLLKINFFYVLDRFDALILKIIFLKKNIILMHFGMKNTLKSNRNYTPKQALKNKLKIRYLKSKNMKNDFFYRQND